MDRTYDKYLESLVRIKNTESDFVVGLRQHLDRLKDSMIGQRDEVSVRLVQGRAQEVRDLLTLMDNADDILRKARR